MLDKTYRPDMAEPRQYAAWERAGCFAADPRISQIAEVHGFCAFTNGAVLHFDKITDARIRL